MKKMTKILWIDLEMTGLDVEKEVIIEVAAIVTEAEPPFYEIEQYHCAVKQPQEYIDRMDDWNVKAHTSSGLTQLIPVGQTPEEAEQTLLAMVEKHFGEEPAVIAGNSISQDRTFIKKYFRILEQKLHYRMLDVTAWKLLVETEEVIFKKKSRHRALEDVQDSIKEMNFYLSFLDHEKIKNFSDDDETQDNL